MMKLQLLSLRLTNPPLRLFEVLGIFFSNICTIRSALDFQSIQAPDPKYIYLAFVFPDRFDCDRK